MQQIILIYLNAKSNKYFFADESKLEDLDVMFADLIEEGNSVGAKLGSKSNQLSNWSWGACF
jgi:hypothetical protein